MAAVLLYHADIGPFRGGYVGVDIFFVVSGFLITGLLLREIDSNGTPPQRILQRFWARRARRLLPMSACVIIATLVVGRFVLDPLSVTTLGRDAVAVGLFVGNVVFARRDGDYFTADAAPSPLLHFWSLAVEEQFYLLWPLVIVAVARFRRHRTAALAVVIAVAWAASFAACVIVTPHDRSSAFYLLPTRAWELLGGAALAVVSPRIVGRIPAPLRAGLGWAGIATVVFSLLTLGDRQDFPGALALWPVAGTLAIVAAGILPAAFGPHRMLSLSPLTWLGRMSYGVYLWHWPALVLAAAAFGPLDTWQRVVVVAGSVAAAAITHRTIENPIRRSAWLTSRPRASLFLGAALGTTVVAFAAVSLALPTSIDAGVTAAPAQVVVPEQVVETPPLIVAEPASPSTTSQPSTTSPPTAAAPTEVSSNDLVAAVAPIVAANSVALDAAALTPDVPANLRPSLARASGDRPVLYDDGCILSDGASDPPPCVFGDPESSIGVVLFGDSHAAQWFPAMQEIAVAHHWRLTVMTKKGCPTADIRILKTGLDAECARWRAAVTARLATDRPDLIVMSAYRYRAGGSGIGLDPDEAWRVGLTTTLDALRPTADRVLLLGDTPTPSVDVPSCLAGHLRSVQQCAATRDRAVKTLRLAVESSVADAHDALVANTADWSCTVTTCPAIVGDVLMYRDDNHLTTAASLLLAPYLDATLAPLLPAG